MSLPGLGVVILISLAYCYLVKVAGPRFMANRPPYKLNGVMKVYNFIQILINCYLFYHVAKFWLTGKYHWLCQTVDYSETDEGLHQVSQTWWGYLSRFVDYFDTFFFVLRKKNNQITFLHVYHHTVVPIIMWWPIRFISGGNASFIVLINTGKFNNVKVTSFQNINSASVFFSRSSYKRMHFLN